MDLSSVFILLALFVRLVSSAAAAAPISHPTNDLSLAMSEMRSKSYYGFVILLDMLNDTTKSVLGQEATFLMPPDHHLSNSAVSPEQLEDFILSHAIPLPIVSGELEHTPAGTILPSFIKNSFFRISRLKRSTFLNNAHIVEPNVCSSALIKCHGINAIIAKRYFQVDSPPSSTNSQDAHRKNSPSLTVHSHAAAPPSDCDRGKA